MPGSDWRHQSMTVESNYIVAIAILSFAILLTGIFCMLLIILTAGLFKKLTGRENAITRWVSRKGPRVQGSRGE